MAMEYLETLKRQADASEMNLRRHGLSEIEIADIKTCGKAIGYAQAIMEVALRVGMLESVRMEMKNWLEETSTWLNRENNTTLPRTTERPS